MRKFIHIVLLLIGINNLNAQRLNELNVTTPSKTDYLAGTIGGIAYRFEISNIIGPAILGTGTPTNKKFLDGTGAWNPIVLAGDLEGEYVNGVINGTVTKIQNRQFDLTTVGSKWPLLWDASVLKFKPSVLPIEGGGTGVTIIGAPGQQIKVNAGGTGLEYFTFSWAFSQLSSHPTSMTDYGIIPVATDYDDFYPLITDLHAGAFWDNYSSIPGIPAAVTGQSAINVIGGKVSIKGIPYLASHGGKWIRIKADTSGLEPFAPSISDISVSSVFVGEIFFSNNGSPQKLISNPSFRYNDATTTLLSQGKAYFGGSIVGTPNANVVVGGGGSSFSGLVIQPDYFTNSTLITGRVAFKPDGHLWWYSGIDDVKLDNEPVTKAIIKAALGGITPADSATVAAMGPPFSDAFSLVKNATTSSKQVRVNASGVTGTRVWTAPDANITLPGTNIANTWDQDQRLNSGRLYFGTGSQYIGLSGTTDFIINYGTGLSFRLLNNYIQMGGVGGYRPPGGTTAQRTNALTGNSSTGLQRYNTDLGTFDFYETVLGSGTWVNYARTINTVSINGNTQQLGSNPSFTITNSSGKTYTTGAFDNTGNSKGISITDTVVTLHAATSSTPGPLAIGDQIFPTGNKGVAQNGTSPLVSGNPPAPSYRFTFNSASLNYMNIPETNNWDIGVAYPGGFVQSQFTFNLNGTTVASITEDGGLKAAAFDAPYFRAEAINTNGTISSPVDLRLSSGQYIGLELPWASTSGGNYFSITPSSFGNPSLSAKSETGSTDVGMNFYSLGKGVFNFGGSGGIVIPRLTATERTALGTPETWTAIICTDCLATDGSTGVMQVYNGSGWKNSW